jgi:hypothetical protein
MKNWILLIAAVVLIYVVGQYAKQVYQYKKYRSCVEEINLLLEAAKADSSKIGKFFKVKDLNLETSPFFQKLIRKGIVGENTEIFYKSKDCICLINKAAPSFDNTFSVTDYIVIWNYDIGKFSNGLDDLYSMNQEEGNQNMKIEAFLLDTETNLFIIKH